MSLYSNPSIIEVEMLEYKHISAPGELHTSVGPCVAVGAIYGKEGFLMHEQMLFHGGMFYLESLLADLRQVKSKDSVKFVVAGTCEESLLKDDERDDSIRVQKSVLELILQAGFRKRNIQLSWGKKETQDVEVIPGKGKFIITDYDD